MDNHRRSTDGTPPDALEPLDARVNHAEARPSSTGQQTFLWHTHDYLGEYARFADTKAGFAGTLAGALLGCLYGAGCFGTLVNAGVRQWTWVMWITASAGTALCIAIGLAVWVVYPRLRHSRKTGLIFWGGVAAFSTASKFKAAFRAKTDDELTEALEQQVYDVSTLVLVPKYRYVSLCLWALVLGGILAGAALLSRDSTKAGASSHPISVGPASHP